VPCGALPRGGTAQGSLTFPASPPASFTPANAKAHVPPFNDVIDNNPCGKQSVITAGGVDVSAQNLCLPHLAMKLGYAAVGATDAAIGATAGAPGSFTPASTTPPASPADLIAAKPVKVTASPGTAWTTGQYVQTQTAGAPGRAYWNGTAWVAGTAP